MGDDFLDALIYSCASFIELMDNVEVKQPLRHNHSKDTIIETTYEVVEDVPLLEEPKDHD